jgi:hemolysin activation/secretion protein
VELGDGYSARHSAAGPHVTFDTRIDPLFPRNAIHTQIRWERLGFGDSSQNAGAGGPVPSFGGASRWSADARGYVGLFGSAVLALRGQFELSDSPLPDAEKSLIGGFDSLRGYRAGHRAGDNMAAASAEVRVPITSPLNFGRFGVKGFLDAGTVWSSSERLADQPFERGIGGGIFLGAAIFKIDLDVAWPEDGKPRVHVGFGTSF